MLRIVDGLGRPFNAPGFDEGSACAYVGKPSDQYRVKAVDLGNGHIEASAVRVIAWEEAEWSRDYLADVLECVRKAHDERDEEEARAKDRQRAARRAKTRVRRLCKVMGADTLLTLTYRAWEDDLSRVKADLKEFNRRMLRVLPAFRFVACFERQKANPQLGRLRGSWHVHIATEGLPKVLAGKNGEFRSFNVIRAIWRSVTGEREGNIDIQRRKRHSAKTAAQVAAYIAKYIGKAFEDDIADGKDRWTKYGAVEVPPAQDLGVVDTLIDAITLTYGLLTAEQDICTARLDKWSEWFFVSGEIRRRRAT